MHLFSFKGVGVCGMGIIYDVVRKAQEKDWDFDDDEHESYVLFHEFLIIGGVSKSMLPLDEAIIDMKEHHIERLKVIIELFREATCLSNCSPQPVS